MQILQSCYFLLWKLQYPPLASSPSQRMLSSTDYELAKSIQPSWLTSEIHTQERFQLHFLQLKRRDNLESTWMPSSSLPPLCKITGKLVNWRARGMIILATFTDWKILQFFKYNFAIISFKCFAADRLCSTVIHTLYCIKSPARLEWCIHRRHHHAYYITRELKYSQDKFHCTVLIEGEKGRGRRSMLSSHQCTEEGQIEKSHISYQTWCILRTMTLKLWILFSLQLNGFLLEETCSLIKVCVCTYVGHSKQIRCLHRFTSYSVWVRGWRFSSDASCRCQYKWVQSTL